MSTKTTNLEMTLLAEEDNFDTNVYNENFQKTDDKIGELNSMLGSEELTTTSQTHSGAINELNKNLKSRIEFEYIPNTTSTNPFSVSHTITEDGLYYVSLGLQKYSNTASNEYISVSNGVRYGWNSYTDTVSVNIGAFIQLKHGDIVTVGSTVGNSCATDYQTLVQIVKI